MCLENSRSRAATSGYGPAQAAPRVLSASRRGFPRSESPRTRGTVHFHEYDLFRAGKPLRIVVVGQEEGGRGGPHTTMEERYKVVHDGSGLNRCFRTRNPHMKRDDPRLTAHLVWESPDGSPGRVPPPEPQAGPHFRLLRACEPVAVLSSQRGVAGPTDAHDVRQL